MHVMAEVAQGSKWFGRYLLYQWKLSNLTYHPCQFSVAEVNFLGGHFVYPSSISAEGLKYIGNKWFDSIIKGFDIT